MLAITHKPFILFLPSLAYVLVVFSLVIAYEPIAYEPIVIAARWLKAVGWKPVSVTARLEVGRVRLRILLLGH